MAPIAARPQSAVCRVWVLGRASSDFSIGDREVALALQPLLTAVTRHFVKSFGRNLPAEAAALLTERESVVLTLLLAGNRPTAIAAQLEMSPRTVHKHLERIYRKFAVHDRHGLAHVVNGDMCANGGRGVWSTGHINHDAGATVDQASSLTRSSSPSIRSNPRS